MARGEGVGVCERGVRGRGDRARAWERCGRDGGRGAAPEEQREKRSPRTREPKSLEDVLRAKEAAKERKRRVREEQELLAKQEEEERAEIARLVVLERARREAADARAAAEELERKRESGGGGGGEEEEEERAREGADRRG